MRRAAEKTMMIVDENTEGMDVAIALNLCKCWLIYVELRFSRQV